MHTESVACHSGIRQTDQESIRETQQSLGPDHAGRLRLRHQDRTQHLHVCFEDHERQGRAPSSRSKAAPRNEDAKGPNPTIATYIAQNNIKVTPARLHPMHLGGVRLSVNMLRTTLHKDHPHRFECA